MFGFSCLDEENVPEPSDIVLTQQNAGSGRDTDTDGKTDGEETPSAEGETEEDEEEDAFEVELTPEIAREYVSIEFELTVIKKCNVEKEDIDDLNVDQLAGMDKEDPCYDIKINDFGYMEQISGLNGSVQG